MVFLQPDGPTRQMNSSGAMSIWTSSSTAGPEPKRTPIPASEKIGVRSDGFCPAGGSLGRGHQLFHDQLVGLDRGLEHAELAAEVDPEGDLRRLKV